MRPVRWPDGRDAPPPSAQPLHQRPLNIYAGRKRTLTAPPPGSCEVQQGLRSLQSHLPSVGGGVFFSPRWLLFLDSCVASVSTLFSVCLSWLSDVDQSCSAACSQDLNVNPIQRCYIVSTWSLHLIVAADLIRLFSICCCSFKFLLPTVLSNLWGGKRKKKKKPRSIYLWLLLGCSVSQWSIRLILEAYKLLSLPLLALHHPALKIFSHLTSRSFIRTLSHTPPPPPHPPHHLPPASF